jgi:FMN phosphatase YigB (HAD superfamily)
MAIKAVFFDVGNTLLFLNHSVVLKPLYELGVYSPSDLLLETERETKREFDSLQGHATVDRGFWQIYYSRLLDKLKVANDAIHDQLVTLTRISANWCQIKPGTRCRLL